MLTGTPLLRGAREPREDCVELASKACSKCREVKSFSEFSKTKSNKDGHQRYCKPCHQACMRLAYQRHKEKRKAAQAEWYANNREQYAEYKRGYYQQNKVEIGKKNKANRFLREYGLTMEDHAAMMEAQNGMCPLGCGREAMVVDHCHATGRVRGLLCSPCNWMLGQADDNPAVLRNAADYIEASRMGVAA